MLHEDRKNISNETQDMKRAIDSLKEELEAVDWYNQRAQACQNPELKKILEHNANEEKEHSSMLMERIRKNDTVFDAEMSEYLFKNEDIANQEED